LTDYEALYREHGDFLRGYCYRLSGSVADAHDVVQETFVRALERPPRDTTRPWRPWLVRVASNLVKDRLRRSRREYVGPWLPSPIVTQGEGTFPWQEGLDDAEGRYEALESVTYAFLLSLEALSPTQRAVLLLRDVYDYSTRECADALGLTLANVKTSLHRARAALRLYDEDRRRPSPELHARTAGALERLLSCFAARDAQAMELLLANDVNAYSDGGGRFYAARKPVVGPAKVALFFSNIAAEDAGSVETRFCELNGLPAVLLSRPDAPSKFARRWSFAVDLDATGAVRRTYSVLVPEKLAALGDQA
jgi:RNA polymerase sigma-70 factor (ECF subfamily)